MKAKNPGNTVVETNSVLDLLMTSNDLQCYYIMAWIEG